MRLLLVTTLLLAVLPAAAAARVSGPAYVSAGEARSVAAFPIDGRWEWGGPETGFGDRGGAHDGEDVFASCGTPLVAARGGKVVVSDSDGSAGIHLVIRLPDRGGDHVYMHLEDAPPVAVGDRVRTGERIGAVGRSGNASACHLHFERWTPPGWYRGGEARDPRPRLEAWSGRARGS